MRLGFIIAVLLTSISASAQLAQLAKAKKMQASAKKISGVELTSYNCFIMVMDLTAGKCQMTFEKGGQHLDLIASPEVAAIYANPTKYAQAPFPDLTITVAGKEVLRIEDATGERISEKIDYSR